MPPRSRITPPLAATDGAQFCRGNDSLANSAKRRLDAMRAAIVADRRKSRDVQMFNSEHTHAPTEAKLAHIAQPVAPTSP